MQAYRWTDEEELAMLARAMKEAGPNSRGDASLEAAAEIVAASLKEPSEDPSRHGAGPYPQAERWDHQVICDIVEKGSSVLDLGCGGGDLLSRLISRNGVRGQGIDLHQDSVAQCIAKGVPVIQADIDRGLAAYSEGSFDYVILETTLQTVRKPLKVLEEMQRVGRLGIVSFPNFGYLPVRTQLLVRGLMPVTPRLPYTWAETPNIHLLTIRDFEAWCGEHRVSIERRIAYANGKIHSLTPIDNVLAEEAMYVIRRGGAA